MPSSATRLPTDDGRKRLVRHGHLPEREIMTGIGPVGVRCPRLRDRVGEGSQRIRFSARGCRWRARLLASPRRGMATHARPALLGHKTANVLNKLPKSQQSKAKRALQEIWMAETKKDALLAFDAFIETWGVKYDRATECLIKDRDALLAFYDFPAGHWKHLRTTNVIESSFATVRHRTVRSKGCLSNKTAPAHSLTFFFCCRVLITSLPANRRKSARYYSRSFNCGGGGCP